MLVTVDITGVGCTVVFPFVRGTLLFEFVYLSRITRNPIYAKKGFSGSVKFKQTELYGLYPVDTAWPSSLFLVGVPLKPLAGFTCDISEFRYPVMLVNSQLVASCKLGFLILLCFISSISKQLDFHKAGMIALKLPSLPQQSAIMSINSLDILTSISILHLFKTCFSC